MSEVYFCYSKWNQNEAAEITTLLESAGLDCWLISRDIRFSQNWDEQVENAIKNSVISVYLEPQEPSLRVLDEVEFIKTCNTQLMAFDPSKTNPAEIAQVIIASIDEAREIKERRSRIYPYAGSDPFVFASYSHRDMETVFDIIRRLQKHGYRVWFDEGIDPGTEWDEYIAEHINSSSYMIAFLSDNYFGSSNCRDELAFARDIGKPLLLVYIRNEELPPGMKLRLNRLQAIHWYSFENAADFLIKVDSAAGIGECRSKGDE